MERAERRSTDKSGHNVAERHVSADPPKYLTEFLADEADGVPYCLRGRLENTACALDGRGDGSESRSYSVGDAGKSGCDPTEYVPLFGAVIDGGEEIADRSRRSEQNADQTGESVRPEKSSDRSQNSLYRLLSKINDREKSLGGTTHAIESCLRWLQIRHEIFETLAKGFQLLGSCRGKHLSKRIPNGGENGTQTLECGTETVKNISSTPEILPSLEQVVPSIGHLIDRSGDRFTDFGPQLG